MITFSTVTTIFAWIAAKQTPESCLKNPLMVDRQWEQFRFDDVAGRSEMEQVSPPRNVHRAMQGTARQNSFHQISQTVEHCFLLYFCVNSFWSSARLWMKVRNRDSRFVFKQIALGLQSTIPWNVLSQHVSEHRPNHWCRHTLRMQAWQRLHLHRREKSWPPTLPLDVHFISWCPCASITQACLQLQCTAQKHLNDFSFVDK